MKLLVSDAVMIITHGDAIFDAFTNLSRWWERK